MKATFEFWLAMHALSAAYRAEGGSPQERSNAIVNRFLSMPPISRQELLDDFWPLAQNMAELYRQALAAHRRAELSTPSEWAG